MSETERNSLFVKPKISKLAVTSLLFGFSGLVVIFLRVFFYRPWWSEYAARNVTLLLGIIGLIFGFAALMKISRRIAAIIISVILFLLLLQPFFAYVPRSGKFSIVGFVQSLSLLLTFGVFLVLIAMPIIPKLRFIIKNYGRNGAFANTGIALCAFLVLFWWLETCQPRQLALRMACGSNLAHLEKTIQIYSKEHQGRYPNPEKWCTELLKYEQMKKIDFLCAEFKYRWKHQVLPWPVPKNKECYYAMNPDCEPNSPMDTVLLFETEGGWNRFGGPEILSTQNHSGEGCNVLFNGGYVQFIGTRQLADLKWNPE